MSNPGDHRHLRLSDADREAAAQRLNVAMGEGRITLAELEERLDMVYRALTFADLEPPLADLPLPPGAVQLHPEGAIDREQRDVVELRTEMGTIVRDGDWTVPRRLRIRTSMGSVKLDLRRAVVPHPVVEVEVSSGMGSITIIVPEGVTANVDGVRTSMGTVRSRVPSVPGTGFPHLRLTGSAGMGSVTIRHAAGSWWRRHWFG
ncbi:DUF1707 domain-containing protein [Pseudonocardia sp. H11422]|uniref:DUF1707 SHOCT-like domain-containing protein n=1 Tax=Pseudonocardia sp. H11422 TaxID=2835866 RepID=UPI001BDC2E00|nr:DUF1707 domain-containing protein [Pseudonocardia sp. H11422]